MLTIPSYKHKEKNINYKLGAINNPKQTKHWTTICQHTTITNSNSSNFEHFNQYQMSFQLLSSSNVKTLPPPQTNFA
jgi:hypothetical protein